MTLSTLSIVDRPQLTRRKSLKVAGRFVRMVPTPGERE